MGEEKVWHFAHVGELCAALKKIDADTQDGSLLTFQTKESATIDVSDSLTFLCPLCKAVGQKQNAIRLPSQQYVCKSCYTTSPATVLDRL
jgi:transposase-like protein